jgi:hypothetical protein
MLENEKSVLTLIVGALSQETAVRKIVAYGSRVRGDFRRDSDFDVFVLVSKKTPELKSAIRGIFYNKEHPEMEAHDAERRELGEMGKLGYLMTKQFGPRVRLGAVTTNLPLIADKPVDLGVEDFCRVSKKCAVCCPSHSIPTGERQEVNGILRWKLNAETCFDYWGKIGTDCNVCMRVCPWSHARTLPRRVIVELVSRNRLSRRLFHRMDDVFYGRKPKPKAPPDWTRLKA